ncbi:unnamed protein product [Fusarium graminearum]|uniref:Uncharacterized protein n=1 Tax=Gibberella zeae TaxID=5518 RepID=A0A4E9E556_GIBZA|nr:unnamed protein product [Fusarium graminearum]CAF3493301.1 unnamed protein product [Fusarium graminearum]CAG1966412.1 unnamed protein product [Fusarium graminearum]CAG1976676.1 unnamed protein product [Fusarium graminearum]
MTGSHTDRIVCFDSVERSPAEGHVCKLRFSNSSSKPHPHDWVVKTPFCAPCSCHRQLLYLRETSPTTDHASVSGDLVVKSASHRVLLKTSSCFETLMDASHSSLIGHTTLTSVGGF